MKIRLKALNCLCTPMFANDWKSSKCIYDIHYKLYFVLSFNLIFMKLSNTSLLVLKSILQRPICKQNKNGFRFLFASIISAKYVHLWRYQHLVVERK